MAYLNTSDAHSFNLLLPLPYIDSNISNPIYLLNLKAGAAFLPLDVYLFASCVNCFKFNKFLEDIFFALLL